MPFGSEVVPEVKRICSGVSRPRLGSCKWTGEETWGKVSARSSSASLGTRALKLQQERTICGNQAGPGFGDDAPGEVHIASGVEGNHQDSTQHAAKECRDPLCAVPSPQHHALANGHVALDQSGGEALRQMRQFSIAARILTSAAVKHHRTLPAMPAEVVDERSQMRAHNGTSMPLNASADRSRLYL